MKTTFLFISIITILSFNSYAQRIELVWSDEFDSTHVNDEIWTPWFGTAFNNEHQYYTPREKNLSVNDGKLNLIGIRENYSGRNWTSARIKTENAVDFKYGILEVRAKLPAGQGLWPAIWMMPTDDVHGSWPYSGEIDIMENKGHEMDKIQHTVHYSAYAHPGTGNAVADRRSLGGEFTLSGEVLNEFHTYKIKWTPDSLIWYFDGNKTYDLTRGEIESGAEVYPFDEKFYIILNLAIGGDYLGEFQPTESTPDTNIFEVDYVRLYQEINKKPTISTGYPREINLDTNEIINLQANVSDPDGEIELVSFFINDKLIATDSIAPYSSPWQSNIYGCYTLSVEAKDNDNGITKTENSGMFVVGEGCEKKSFSENPHTIPGILEFENYDYGGLNVSYFDFTEDTNSGNAYRLNESVDIKVDPFDDSNHLISDVQDREWTEYTVDVQESGYYDITLRLISDNASGRVDLLVDGETVTNYSRVTSPCGNYKCKTRTGILLNSGQKIIRILSATSAGDLDRIEFTLTTPVSTDEQPNQLPEDFLLKQNYPNPFNPETTIRFNLPEASVTQLIVYNSLGQIVRKLVDEKLSSGLHSINFEATNMSSGIYYYKLITRFGIESRKMTLIK